MAEINVEFVNFSRTAQAPDQLREAVMLRGAISAAQRAIITSTALAGEDLIAIPSDGPYTHALVTARGADLRVRVAGPDDEAPVAGQTDALVPDGQTLDFRLLAGGTISAVLDEALSED